MQAFRTLFILGTLSTFGGAAYADQVKVQACGGEPGYPPGIQTGVYQGNIGNRPVYLQLTKDGGESFYAGVWQDISLDAFHEGEELILQETVWHNDLGSLVPTGCLRLVTSPIAGGQLMNGQWLTPDARKKLDARFTPLNVQAMPLKQLDSPALEKLRREEPLSFIKMNRPWTAVKGGIREPLTKVIYPRLNEPLTSPANQRLQTQQMQSALNILVCLASTDGASDMNVSAQIPFVSRHLFSLVTDEDEYCGGPHPESGVSLQTYDRQDARLVDIKQIWPSLTSQKLHELYLKQLGTGLDGCQDSINESSIAAALGAKGIILAAHDLPHVIQQACGGKVTVPYASLKRWANSKSRYYHDIYQ